jgi:hypothetical protein
VSSAGAPQQPGVAPGQPIHLHEAATQQRDRTVTGFDAQREAILKAVEEQRLAAMSPIRAAQQRQTQAHPAQPLAPGMTAAGTAQPNRTQAVLADIVLTLKAMVAEEVRLQLVALLAAAEARQKSAAQTPPAPSGS